MTAYDDERIALLLAELPPAPAGWVQAAQELPAARAELDDLVERAVRDTAFRSAVLADLERALQEAGQTADPTHLAALRARLST